LPAALIASAKDTFEPPKAHRLIICPWLNNAAKPIDEFDELDDEHNDFHLPDASFALTTPMVWWAGWQFINRGWESLICGMVFAK
jgi:hypothetical protein